MIEVEDLSFMYPDGTQALSHVSLDIQSGETVLIAGPNGSGKSTLARHFNALYLPTEGSVRVKGVSTYQDELHARIHVGMVFQNPDDQIVGSTVEKDIAFGPENLGLSPSEVKERVEEVIQLMGLGDLRGKSPHLLSEGQKRRVAIAGVLAMKPGCIVFDELFSGLDLPSRTSLIDELVKLKGLGYTLVVFCTDLEDVWCLADRLMIMENGGIVKEGKPLELILEGVENHGVCEPAIFKLFRAFRGWTSEPNQSR